MQSRLPANRRNSVNGRGLEAAFLTIGGSFPRLPPSPLSLRRRTCPTPAPPPDQCWRCAPPPAIRAAPLCPASCYIHEDRGWRSTRWPHPRASPTGPPHPRRTQVSAMLRNFPQARRLLRRMGFEKEDAYFWKQMGKALLCTYTLFGVAWIWNETSPLGWWTLKPRPKEEKEMAHLYERRKFPYPGDEEAVEEFIKSGGALGTTIGPKGFADANMDSENMQKQLQSKKFEQEAQKLWLRMRNEVIQELQEKGFDIE
ncbi:hypothetical protein PVAP13_2NG362300 [Panicum virgatum]|uniref:Uncharacterized protein n=2 Tax=Panicum virgatum TaxID=38727 RepID=A0A8T0VPM1_PANVG|nr:hypothetical protein PVAP13_2NG362300 [Panicum virgatum]